MLAPVPLDQFHVGDVGRWLTREAMMALAAVVSAGSRPR